MKGCYSLMVGMNKSLQLDFDAAFIENQDIALLKKLKNKNIPTIALLISGRPMILGEALFITHPRFHDKRTPPRLRNRLPALPAIHRHRHGHRIYLDVDGHDDVAADDDLTAVQADLLRPRGWLVPRSRQSVWCRVTEQ